MKIKSFYIAVVLMSCLGFVGCNGEIKSNYSKFVIGDSAITEAGGDHPFIHHKVLKLGGTLTPNTTTPTLSIDSIQRGVMTKWATGSGTKVFQNPKQDTIYIYRDTCIEGINDTGFNKGELIKLHELGGTITGGLYLDTTWLWVDSSGWITDDTLKARKFYLDRRK